MLTEQRKGNIAMLYLKHKLRSTGLRLTPNFKREVGNTAKSLGISYEEALEFAENLVRELVDEMFVDAQSKKKLQ